MGHGHNSDTNARMSTDPRPAPPDLEHLRMFLNTDSRFHSLDLIQDEERRPAWFARHLPDFDIESLDDRAWARVLDLRDAIRALLEKGSPDGRLSRLARSYPDLLVFDEDGRARLSAGHVGGEQEIAVALLAALHVALADGRLARLRLCERPGCGWAFYDGTRNRAGRWCSANPCGDVMKARAYRSRKRGADDATPQAGAPARPQ
jgi:predicted RNA-binding Zn ribbon-like protein